MLVIFDVDGTLTRTCSLDGEAYERAFLEAFGVELPTASWASYRNATDRGILEEALVSLGLDPADPRGEAMQARFLTLLSEGLCDRGSILQVPGASALLKRLQAEGYQLAIATGCWEASARLKLDRAGIHVAGIPLAASDGAPAREDILLGAVRAAGSHHGRVVYVGDGVWDVRTTARLGIAFVGVDCDGTGCLGGLGAFEVLPNFEDLESFLRALARAMPPAMPQEPSVTASGSSP